MNVVVLGDSLSAGFQNGSLLDAQQPNGWASLLAAQAKFPLQLPLIAAPGAPAVLELLSLGDPPVTESESGITIGRDNVDIQPHDLAVPGQTLHQLLSMAPTTSPATDEEILADLVVGFPLSNSLPQLGEGIGLKPTTVFLWIGANDALQALETGDPAKMTSLAGFTADFTELIDTLQTRTHAHLVVANIPDFTAIPYMTKGSLLLAEAEKATNLSQAVLSKDLDLQPADLLNGGGLDDFNSEMAAWPKTKKLTPLPGQDVLTAAEIVTSQNTTNSYNQVIAKLVAGAGGTLIDLHALYAGFGAGIKINGYLANAGWLGGLYSLDGVHPTNTGYALIANEYITATNEAFGLSVPLVDVSAVAAKDPYFGPNIKPVAASAHIPAFAARRIDALLKSSKQE